MFKGVIFDLDGTHVNSLEDITNAMNVVLKQHDFNNDILLEANKIKGKLQPDNKNKSKLQQIQ